MVKEQTQILRISWQIKVNRNLIWFIMELAVSEKILGESRSYVEILNLNRVVTVSMDILIEYSVNCDEPNFNVSL